MQLIKCRRLPTFQCLGGQFLYEALYWSDCGECWPLWDLLTERVFELKKVVQAIKRTVSKILVQIKPETRQVDELKSGQRFPQSYLTQSVLEVLLQKSIPTQIRQLILSISNGKG